MINTKDLFAEFAEANGRLTPKTFAHLESLGVDRACWFGTRGSLIGAQSVCSIEGEYYQPGEAGRAYYVCPVGSHVAGIWQSLDDLCAWSPSQPDRWYLRTRNGILLNPDEPDRCRLFESPLELHATPLDWLRAGGRGMVVLDWSINLRLMFGRLSHIICNTPQLAERLSAGLNDNGKLPQVRVRQEVSNVAA